MTLPNVKGLFKKKKQSVECPNIPWATLPVSLGEGLPIPNASKPFSLESNEEDSEDGEDNEDCSPGSSMSMTQILT